MNGQRAVEILTGFTKGQLAFTAQEIDELLKTKLVVEMDPRDFATLQWLQPAIAEAVESTLDDPELGAKLATKYAELDERLKSDWHRFTTTKKHIDEEEAQRRLIRRLLGQLGDVSEMERLKAMIAASRIELVQNTPYYKCEALGDELYAITARGLRVLPALAQRLDRYRDYPLAAFLKAFDKTEAKMNAFAGDISTLAGNLPTGVSKNPHQIVIGLVKTGKSPKEAIHDFRLGMRSTGAPDVAVTLARNAAAHGGADNVQARLHQAVLLLQEQGFPKTPATFGAAKTLLPFEPLRDGVVRFNNIAALLLRSAFNSDRDTNVKLTARLMPADGDPQAVVARAHAAFQALRQSPSKVVRVQDERMTAIALAAMCRSDDQVPTLVARFRTVESELVRYNVSDPTHAPGDALECVACPGSPSEVAETVRTLMGQVALKQGRTPNRADVAVAVAFAKRFAY